MNAKKQVTLVIQILFGLGLGALCLILFLGGMMSGSVPIMGVAGLALLGILLSLSRTLGLKQKFQAERPNYPTRGRKLLAGLILAVALLIWIIWKLRHLLWYLLQWAVELGILVAIGMLLWRWNQKRRAALREHSLAPDNPGPVPASNGSIIVGLMMAVFALACFGAGRQLRVDLSQEGVLLRQIAMGLGLLAVVFSALLFLPIQRPANHPAARKVVGLLMRCFATILGLISIGLLVIGIYLAREGGMGLVLAIYPAVGLIVTGTLAAGCWVLGGRYRRN